MQLRIDQEFKNLIPPLTFDERTGLKENLMKNGCLDSIKTWNGVIVDGHNRYDICTESKLDFNTDELSFKDKNDVKIWMIRQQLDKRNVNDYIRTSLCLKMEGIYQEKAKANQKLSAKIGDLSNPKKTNSVQQNSAKPKIKPIETRKEIAKEAGVSHDTVSKVKYIEDKATEEQKEELAENKTSIHRVYTELKKQHEPKDEEKEPKDEEKNTDHCMFTPFIPYKSQVSICPCGCGYGYCEINEIWYSPNEVLELEGE